MHGELLGVLDASAVRSPDERESQRLVNHIVRQSALLIEDAYFLNAATDCWVLLAHRNRHYVEAQPEILIAIDACGNAVAASVDRDENLRLSFHVVPVANTASSTQQSVSAFRK